MRFRHGTTDRLFKMFLGYSAITLATMALGFIVKNDTIVISMYAAYGVFFFLILTLGTYISEHEDLGNIMGELYDYNAF